LLKVEHNTVLKFTIFDEVDKELQISVCNNHYFQLKNLNEEPLIFYRYEKDIFSH